MPINFENKIKTKLEFTDKVSEPMYFNNTIITEMRFSNIIYDFTRILPFDTLPIEYSFSVSGIDNIDVYNTCDINDYSITLSSVASSIDIYNDTEINSYGFEFSCNETLMELNKIKYFEGVRIKDILNWKLSRVIYKKDRTWEDIASEYSSWEDLKNKCSSWIDVKK